MIRILPLVVLALTLACTQSNQSQQASTQTADLVLHNGMIVTMDDAMPRAEAIAALDGKVIAVGKEADIKAMIGENTEVIDLQGATAIPAFIEGHGHIMGIGQAKLNLNLMPTQNWNEIVEMVRAAVAEAQPGEWIVGRGWHQEKWNEEPPKRVEGYPTHDLLSAVSPDNPVLVRHASGHAAFANAKAMELAGITADTADPAGGKIVRDETGAAIGVFEETAEYLVGQKYQAYLDGLTPEQREEIASKQLSLALEECLSNGIASFHDAGSSFSDIDRYKRFADEGKLGVRLWIMASEPNPVLAEGMPEYSKIKGYGDNRLTVGGIKRYMDGALGSRGAWLLEPYTDLPTSVGQNVSPVSVIEEAAEIAKANNVQLCTHAIGDRGNRVVLDVYERVLKGEDRRWRIEHAQHLHVEDIPRFASLNVIPSMQAVHCTSDAPFVVKRLGEQRAEEGAYVWRTLTQAGAVVTNGTDAPVEDISPLDSFYATVTRQPATGPAFFPKESLGAMDALKTYTLNNAYAAYEEDIKGSLEVGKLADITVLSEDITSIDPEKIRDAQIKYTIVGGKVAYKAQ